MVTIIPITIDFHGYNKKTWWNDTKNNGDDTMKLNEEDAIFIISYRWKNWARCDVIKKETKTKKDYNLFVFLY